MLLNNLFGSGVNLLDSNLAVRAKYFIPIKVKDTVTKEASLTFGVFKWINILIDKKLEELTPGLSGVEETHNLKFLSKSFLEPNNFVEYDSFKWRIDKRDPAPGEEKSKGYWYTCYKEVAERVNISG
jgi:hypothetical protein